MLQNWIKGIIDDWQNFNGEEWLSVITEDLVQSVDMKKNRHLTINLLVIWKVSLILRIIL